jgi:predicted esterase
MGLIHTAVAGGLPKVTEADVRYGKTERSKLDFWKAESKKPTPLLVYFHGGGFKFGDKSEIGTFVPVQTYLDQGISCVSVSYPFLQHTNNNYSKIMKECEKAMSFIKKKAPDWNVDKKKIAVSGASAGALITEWIGTRTRGIAAMNAWLQPMGTDRMILKKIRSSCPPIIIIQESPENDAVHHPKYAIMLKKACDKKRVECILYGGPKNDIDPPPAGKNPREMVLAFFKQKWGMN